MLLEGLNTDQMAPRGSTDKREYKNHQEVMVTQRGKDPTLLPQFRNPTGI